MKGIVVHQVEGKPNLTLENVPAVAHSADEVLVDIKASAVNRADLMQARGGYPPPPGASEILGLEMAGVVSAVGANVSDVQVGDRVAALLAGGGYAEQIAIHPKMLFKLPDDWSFVMGAAVPEVWLTAYVNLFLEGGLQSGETVLIHAGGSGVGTAAIQLARETGAIPMITAGTEAKLERGRALGAQVAINYKEQDFVAEVMQATENKGVNLVLDPVGASYFEKNINVLARHGRMVNIGLLGGAVATANIAPLLIKNLMIKGSTLRARPLAEKIEITTGFIERFWSLFLEGTLQPVIDKTFPLAEAQQAHEYIAADKNIGKVILEVG